MTYYFFNDIYINFYMDAIAGSYGAVDAIIEDRTILRAQARTHHVMTPTDRLQLHSEKFATDLTYEFN
jgi:hypothetical protein